MKPPIATVAAPASQLSPLCNHARTWLYDPPSVLGSHPRAAGMFTPQIVNGSFVSLLERTRSLAYLASDVISS